MLAQYSYFSSQGPQLMWEQSITSLFYSLPCESKGLTSFGVFSNPENARYFIMRRKIENMDGWVSSCDLSNMKWHNKRLKFYFTLTLNRRMVSAQHSGLTWDVPGSSKPVQQCKCYLGGYIGCYFCVQMRMREKLLKSAKTKCLINERLILKNTNLPWMCKSRRFYPWIHG